METSTILQQFPDQKAAAIKTDLLHFYKAALSYLEKWYDFSDNYQNIVASLALKSNFTFSHFCDAAEVLQIQKKLDMDELYEEYSDFTMPAGNRGQKCPCFGEVVNPALRHKDTKYDCYCILSLQHPSHKCLCGESVFPYVSSTD
ncbi:hypothetical protein ABVT39_012944 [Epinephelus coioides]